MQKAIIKPSSLSALGEPQNNFCSLAATKVRFQSPVLEMQKSASLSIYVDKSAFCLMYFYLYFKNISFGLVGYLFKFTELNQTSEQQKEKKKSHLPTFPKNCTKLFPHVTDV